MRTSSLKLASKALFSTIILMTITAIIILMSGQPLIKTHPATAIVIATIILTAIHNTFILALVAKNMAKDGSFAKTHMRNKRPLNQCRLYSIGTIIMIIISPLALTLAGNRPSPGLFSAENLIYLFTLITAISIFIATSNNKDK